jgi:predicted TIM-barrel fold metal-dependent hydrolase
VHVALSWYEPIETVIYQMDANGVTQATLIQEMAQTNTDYLFESARRYPGRLAVVPKLDPTWPDATAVVENLAARGASGVRLRAAERSRGSDPFALWRAAGRLGLAISCSGQTTHFLDPEFARAAEAARDVPIVAEHLGAASTIEGESATSAVRLRVLDVLSRFPNLYVKIHGLGEYSPRVKPAVEPFPFELPIQPLIEKACDAFGPQRMMWGSDYPPVSQREGYRNALRFPMDVLSRRADADRALIFGAVAAKIFPVRSAPG